MKHYIGLDVSMKRTFICVLNEQGKTDKNDVRGIAEALQSEEKSILYLLWNFVHFKKWLPVAYVTHRLS
ncbi:hypothetical protein RHABOEDO_000007 [Candidatus Rhabdochlamydia oedothoracis]|uniref:Transposase IS111A/IS1328/IS1533 N-terminal domain-containing protein n=1 Tax=Candidatus Rhabdochlamydia oedothoracis TaxID=2720720 RepID=A0ABX8UZ94_9BACT|nr:MULTISPECIES: hypothetical protein [Rhabdochlamydia]KAG6559013.1 hypothetical protein RHOW815_000981 [Candidatus Rhabdochlamydia sp. W815]QYF47941.1 hypothetical protein RHABOEDO_000007 [Candidatus Rhabdochlamydia oedothoracis]